VILLGSHSIDLYRWCGRQKEEVEELVDEYSDGKWGIR
jgi:hypothetical protein